MLHLSGRLLSLVAATVLAIVPAGPALADVAPPDPLDAVAATPAAAADAADALAAKLVRAGLSAPEAQALVARLGAEERALLAERAEGAEVGGFVPWIAFGVIAGIVFGFMALFGGIDAATGDDAPPAEGPAPAPAPAPASGQPETLRP